MGRIKPTDITHFTDRNGRKLKRRWPSAAPIHDPLVLQKQFVQPEPDIESRVEELKVRFFITTFNELSDTNYMELKGFYVDDAEVENRDSVRLRYVGDDIIDLQPGEFVTIKTGICIDLKHPNRVGVISTDDLLTQQGVAILGGLKLHSPNEDVEIELPIYNFNSEETASILPGDVVGLYTLQHRIGINQDIVDTLISR